MLSPDDLRLLDAFTERRYIPLSRGEAAELGSEVLESWDASAADGVLVDGRYFLALREDARRWCRLTGACTAAIGFVGCVAVVAIVLSVLGLITWWWS